jgi:hypothetical protein
MIPVMMIGGTTASLATTSITSFTSTTLSANKMRVIGQASHWTIVPSQFKSLNSGHGGWNLLLPSCNYNM